MGSQRIIIAVDFDAFYCGVEEHFDPSLVDTPFIVYQKNCVATLSYSARKLGLKKLSTVTEVHKKYPDIRAINGESLARYREQGKALWKYIKSLLPGAPVERLGLEEMWIDVTDIVTLNLESLIEADVLFRGLSEEVEDGLDQGWRLKLSAEVPIGEFDPEFDPESESFGEEQSNDFLCEDFFFQTPAKVFPSNHGCEMPKFLQTESNNAEDFYLDLKLYIASHIAKEVMTKVYMCMGYSCSMGVATNKALAKMAGSFNKPAGLTVLTSSGVQEFMNSCHVKKIPWFGSKSRWAVINAMKYDSKEELKVSTVLDYFKDDERSFLRLFPPSQGETLWDLLHGIDNSPVKTTTEMQTQISIENTFKTVNTLALAELALKPIVESLVSQITTDLIELDTKSWIGYPTTIRLSARFALSVDTLKGRVSHSQSLTSFAPFYKLCEMQTEHERTLLANNLRQSLVIPMLRKLCFNNNLSPSAPHIHFQMLNVAVTGITQTKPVLSAFSPSSQRSASKRSLDHYFSRTKS